MRIQILVSVLVAITCALAGCAQPTSGDDPHDMTPTTPAATFAPFEATFVAKQSAPPGPEASDITYSFDGPATLAAGWVTLHMRNDGFEPHQVGLMRLHGMPFDDYHATLMDGNATMDMHMMGDAPAPAGGVGIVLPGQNTTATVWLEPGEYAAVCVIPGPVGPHHMHGMVQRVSVVNSTEPAPEEEEPTAKLTLNDYSFSLEGNLTPGRHVLEIVNEGTHHHEAPMIRLVGNATPQDVLAAFEPGATAPPPIDWGGGAWSIAPGGREFATVDLAPGRYLLFCFEQDSRDAPPHIALGMIHEFEVA